MTKRSWPIRRDVRSYGTLGWRVAVIALGVMMSSPTQAQEPATCSLGHLGVAALPAPVLDRFAEDPSQANLQAWVEALTDPRLRGRGAATPEAARVVRWLAEAMDAFGLRPVLPGNELCQIIPIEYSAADHNAVAGSSDPAGSARPVVLVMAHFDSLGTDPYSGRAYPGANDNASGVAVLMELARIVASRPEPYPFDTVFLATGAQMSGRVGSQYFVSHPPFRLDRLRLVIELDIVGRQMLDGLWTRILLGDPVDTIGYSAADLAGLDVRALVDRAAAESGISVVGIPQSVVESMDFSSDVTSFAGVAPTLALSTGGTEDFHALTDTAEKLDPGQMERAVRLVLAVLAQVGRDADPSE